MELCELGELWWKFAVKLIFLLKTPLSLKALRSSMRWLKETVFGWRCHHHHHHHHHHHPTIITILHHHHLHIYHIHIHHHHQHKNTIIARSRLMGTHRVDHLICLNYLKYLRYLKYLKYLIWKKQVLAHGNPRVDRYTWFRTQQPNSRLEVDDDDNDDDDDDDDKLQCC